MLEDITAGASTVKPSINCITLPVDDLRKSIAFYRDGLGLPTDGVSDGDDHAALELPGGFYLVLILRTEFSEFTKLTDQAVAARGSSECILSYFAASKEEVRAILKRVGAASGRQPRQGTGPGAMLDTSPIRTGISGRSCGTRHSHKEKRNDCGRIHRRPRHPPLRGLAGARVRCLARRREGAQVPVCDVDGPDGAGGGGRACRRRLHLTDRRDGVDTEHMGEYQEIDRPRRLVFTFHTERGSPDLSRVCIDIVPLGTGCELTLTHEMDPKWAAYKDRTESGWTMIVEALGKTLD